MPTTSESFGELHLNPGPPPRRRSSISGCKCLLLTLVLVICLGIGMFLTALVIGVARNFFSPHEGMYRNASLEELSPTQRASVVQPLFTRAQEFDVAVTVWLRTGGMHGGPANGQTIEEEEAQAGEPVETPLYSDVVFRGMRLTDKNIFANVNFTVPTAIFRHDNLSNYDLRGSVLLIPTGPSILDTATNFSTWIPPFIDVLPVRAWPFPLGSPDIRNKTLTDDILESFGVSVPLIQFHGVQSRCVAREGHTAPSTSVNDFQDDNEDSGRIPINQSESTSLVTITGQPVLKVHPYVTTRTQIRVVDENRLLNRKDFNKAHKELKMSGCGQSSPTASKTLDRYNCLKSYRKNGQWETQVQLAVEDEATGSFHSEWAYGPYIHVSTYAFGQKDILPIPVSREHCADDSKSENETLSYAPEQDYLDVSWQLSYSGRTPAKIWMSQMTEKYKYYSFDEAEHERVKAHGNAELAHGMLGHRFGPDAHPRRRFGINVIQIILSGAATVLDIRYWFTRTSTVSTSILGTALIAFADIINETTSIVLTSMEQNYTIPGWISGIVFYALTTLLIPLLMIKAIARVEFRWWRDATWLPVMQIAPATHRERSSEKMEARISWRAKTTLFLSLVAIYCLKPPQHYHLIPAVFPVPPTDKFTGLLPAIVGSMSMTGRILQLLVNSVSRKYAGNYRLTAVLSFTSGVIALAEFVPALVGSFESRRGLSAQEFLDLGLLSIAAYQALSLPPVPRESPDEHTD